MEKTIPSYPAPWSLQGGGYIFIYKFSREFVEKEGRVPGFLKGRFSGGFGSVMLVNYEKSNAGPYGELLFIPGKFRYSGKRLDTISKIYVSSDESVFNGRANWGIPKEKADFRFERSGRDEHITVSVGDTVAAEITLRSGRLPFHVSTKLLPFPLVQEYDGKRYFTSFSGKGRGRLARVKSIKISPELFPDISHRTPIAVIKVEPFDITFPVATIE